MLSLNLKTLLIAVLGISGMAMAEDSCTSDADCPESQGCLILDGFETGSCAYI